MRKRTARVIAVELPRLTCPKSRLRLFVSFQMRKGVVKRESEVGLVRGCIRVESAKRRRTEKCKS
jgi:hypothetical protein